MRPSSHALPCCRGFDIDSWRAHLNALTWPEVARQLAITAGLGRRRFKPKREERAKLGQEGEDVVADEGGETYETRVGGGAARGPCGWRHLSLLSAPCRCSLALLLLPPAAAVPARLHTHSHVRPPGCSHHTGDLKLRLPSRLGVGTVKAAAWQVLAEAGPEGMRLEDIAREIQRRGFRDLRSSKTPESTGARGLLLCPLRHRQLAPAPAGVALAAAGTPAAVAAAPAGAAMAVDGTGCQLSGS